MSKPITWSGSLSVYNTRYRNPMTLKMVLTIYYGKLEFEHLAHIHARQCSQKKSKQTINTHRVNLTKLKTY